MLLTALTWLYDAKTLVIYSAMPQILVASIGLLRSPRTVRLDVLASMLVFAGMGGLAGLYLFYQFPLPLFQMLLAATITLFGVYLVVSPNRFRAYAPCWPGLLDTLAGFSAALFGISGPVTMTRLMATFSDKTMIRNYAFAFFLSLNLFRVGGYLLNGTFTLPILEMMLVSGPFIAVALWHSHQLHFHVNEKIVSPRGRLGGSVRRAIALLPLSAGRFKMKDRRSWASDIMTIALIFSEEI